MDEQFTAIIGVVGTLLGTILGWVLGKIKFGKLYIHFDDIKYEFHVPGSMSHIPGKEQNEIYYYILNFIIKIYNNSDDNKVIRDCKLELITKSGERIFEEVYDDETRQFIAHSTKYDEIGVVNIPPKSAINIKAHISSDDIDNILETNTINFIYKKRRTTEKRKLLTKVDYSKQPRFISEEKDYD